MEELKPPESFEFPFEPYDIQKDFMRQLYETIEERKIGIFESPTGTGKSLSIICSALRWLSDHRNRQSIKTQEMSKASSDDWIEEWKNKRSAEVNVKKVAKKVRKRKRPDDVNDEIRKLMRIAKGEETAMSGPDAEFLLADYASGGSDCDSENGETFIEKIYYASRTHSQLSQFVHELKSSPYGSTTIAPIASRASLCVNAKVSKLPTVPQMNEACKQLNSKEGCPYKTPKSLNLMSERLHHDLMDIEEIVSFGAKNQCCPFYGARQALPKVDVAILPYQLLLLPSARAACGIELENSVVIIDEAHNLAGAIESSYAAQLTIDTLTSAYKQLNQYKTKYGARLNAKNMMCVKQLLVLILAMGKCLRKFKGEARTMTTRELIVEAKLDQIDLFKLAAYMAQSQVSNKVKGFHYKQLEGQPDKENETKDNALKSFLKGGKDDQKSPEKKTEKGSIEEIALSPLLQVEIFLGLMLTPGAEIRVIMSDVETKSYRLILLDPGTVFADLAKESRSIILAGGTMKPYDTLKQQLLSGVKESEVKWFSCSHVIAKHQMQSFIVQKGVDFGPFEFNYANASNIKMKKELGMTLLETVKIVPRGVVVFFTSYRQEQSFYDLWRKEGILTKLEQQKTIFREPKKQSEVDQLLAKYGASVRTRGALLFAVVGGKVSEGINFTGDLCRAVIMVGLPFPDLKSVVMKQKMSWLDNRKKGSGQTLYQGLCMRAVNQCVGRAIRNRSDAALILFFDMRYARDGIQRQLPDWIRKETTTFDTFAKAKPRIQTFCKNLENL